MKALSIRAKALSFAILISVACSASCDDPIGVDIEPSVIGFVRDARTNAALAGTTVTVQGKTVISDEVGFYSIDELRAGKTQLTAQREGYTDYAAEVIVGVFTSHDISMEPK